MKPLKIFREKIPLWLLILPPLLSLSLISVIKPAGRFAFAVELAIICLCSFVCGFALAVKSFETSRQRVFGGLIFTGGSLYLVSCVVFLGCGLFSGGGYGYSRPMTPAQTENMRRQQEAFQQQQEKQIKERVAQYIVPRDAAADAAMIDLTAFYNRTLSGQVVPFPVSAANHYQNPGIHTWQEIQFDVRGLVLANWNSRTEINRIPIGQKSSELDFLLGTDNWSRPMTFTNCQLVIHFANGIKVTVPVVYGKDVAASHFSVTMAIYAGRIYPDAGHFANHVDGLYQLPTNSVVWEEQIFPSMPVPKPAYGFYIKRWQNPFPDETVTAIDFEPVQNYSGAFLVAITLQPTKKENQ